MPRPPHSFDVFDTLIARRHGDPARVLQRLEARAGVAGLAAARIAVDRHFGAQGHPYALHDIWQGVRTMLGLDPATTNRLCALEVELEHDEVVPIPENLALVRDGDMLVSDTYLPPEVVRSLLRRAGLTKQTAVVVTNDGKFRGWVWPKLLAQVPIGQHFGDNPHSDGRTPSAAGIRSVIYIGARPSPIERMLAEAGWPALADLAREVRLANPFPDTHPNERHLWLMACQLNLPLLYFASLELERHAVATDLREVFFVSRDCLLWHRLYQILFPHHRSTYLYSSRKCLLKPTESYLEYFRQTWHPQSVIVDLFSTGASWATFFSRLNTKGRCWFIGHVDNYAYLPAAPPTGALDMTALFRTGEFGAPLNKNVEMLNYASHPVVEDVRPLPGGAALPILADALEYDSAPPEAVLRTFEACVAALPHHPELPRSAPVPLGGLIKVFVQNICADARLQTIYPNHQAADAAYLQRILS